MQNLLLLSKQATLSHQRLSQFAARRFSSSVREKEIEFYSNLNDWWSPDGPQK